MSVSPGETPVADIGLEQVDKDASQYREAMAYAYEWVVL